MWAGFRATLLAEGDQGSLAPVLTCSRPTSTCRYGVPSSGGSGTPPRSAPATSGEASGGPSPTTPAPAVGSAGGLGSTQKESRQGWHPGLCTLV